MKTLIIDCNNLLYRANYVTNLRDKHGNRVSGIFNTMKMVQSLIKKYNPNNLIAVWDGGKSKARLQIYPNYKANRVIKKNLNNDKKELDNQRIVIKHIFSYLPIKQIEIKNIEADDVIGFLSNSLKGKKIIISNDNDFIQLVNNDTHVYLPYKDQYLTINNVNDYLGFPVKYYILWKCLVGDSSDNIKGIKGIGPKKATILILNQIKTGRKLPISDHELAILNRNKYLIAIGALLQLNDKVNIKKMYIKESNKSVFNFKIVESIFRKYDFKYLLYDFDYFWINNFKRIRKSFYGQNQKENKK